MSCGPPSIDYGSRSGEAPLPLREGLWRGGHRRRDRSRNLAPEIAHQSLEIRRIEENPLPSIPQAIDLLVRQIEAGGQIQEALALLAVRHGVECDFNQVIGERLAIGVFVLPKARPLLHQLAQK